MKQQLVLNGMDGSASQDDERVKKMSRTMLMRTQAELKFIV